MKVLLIKDFSTQKPWGDEMVESFRSHVQRRQPSAEVEVCGAADAQPLPDPTDYDLIILSGGTVNLITGHWPPWVDGVLNLVRSVVHQPANKTKLLGCCWGHQVIQYALGGQLDDLDDGPRLGVEKLPLLPPGQSFFDRATLSLHKFHKRYVKAPAPGFSILAENNEILMSSNRKALSFQSHPEFTAEISEALVEGDDGSYTSKKAGTGTETQAIRSPHDGELAWDRIMEWVVEE